MAAVFVLLGSSAVNAWDLLIDVADAKRAIGAKEAPLGEEVVPSRSRRQGYLPTGSAPAPRAGPADRRAHPDLVGFAGGDEHQVLESPPHRRRSVRRRSGRAPRGAARTSERAPVPYQPW